MSNEELNDLLWLLRKNGVHRFKSNDLEIEFSQAARNKNPILDNEEVENKVKTASNEEWISDDDLYYSAR